jgi:anti-sigma factor RsiW
VTGEHAGDALSALLDGMLGPDEAAAVHAHLAGCDLCRAELRAVSEARAWVRALPPVEPPIGFGHRRRPEEGWRRGVAAMVATAAAALAVVGFVRPGPSRVEPPVTQLVERHAAAASSSGDPLSELAPAGVPVIFRP